MRRRFFLHLACALLLLCAQQAAFTHAAWHASAQGTASQESKHDDNSHALCVLHGTLAQVLGWIHAACPLAWSPPAAFHALPAALAQPACAILHLPRVRGPPHVS